MMLEILRDSEFFIEAGMLEDDSQMLPDTMRLLHEMMTKDSHISTGRWHKSRKDFEERRFAPSIWPEKAKDLTLGYSKSDTSERFTSSVQMTKGGDLYSRGIDHDYNPG